MAAFAGPVAPPSAVLASCSVTSTQADFTLVAVAGAPPGALPILPAGVAVPAAGAAGEVPAQAVKAAATPASSAASDLDPESPGEAFSVMVMCFSLAELAVRSAAGCSSGS